MPSLRKKMKRSRNYVEREAGTYGKVAAFNGVIEPQIDERLHLYILIYGSSFTPEILTRGASCKELCQYIAEWMNAVCTNRLSPDTRSWLKAWESMETAPPLPRACEVKLPPVNESLVEFKHAVERSIATTNIHTHSKTCIKGKRGKTPCRLAGIHERGTQPLLIKKVKGVCVGNTLSTEVEEKLDAGYDPRQCEFLRPHISGPVVWEQFRPEADGMFVETNTLLSGLTASHCNSSVMNGEDAGDLVDEYQQNYMTKEGAGLKNAAAVMLTALEDAMKYPSVAQDSDTPMRQAQYSATRTVNAFGGAHEWSLSLMVYALLGHKSHVSSESFWYVFPYGFVDELRKSETIRHEGIVNPDDNLSSNSESENCPDDVDTDDFMDWETENNNTPSSIDDAIEELANFAHSEDLSVMSNSLNERHATGGARSYKVHGKTVFFSQVESYKFHGEHFVDYSPTEFASIVDITPRQTSTSAKSTRDRKIRKSFNLDPQHPLFDHYEAVIRAKMLTPMLGGSPPPSCSRKKENGKKMDAIARYIISVAVPWNINQRPEFELNTSGLARLCTLWDRSTASFVMRQRYRQVHHFIQKHIRNSDHEKICLDWRARNATRWKEGVSDVFNNTSQKKHCRQDTCDPEADGILSGGEDYLYWLTRAAALGNPIQRDSIQALQATFFSTMGFEDEGIQSIEKTNRVVPASIIQTSVYQRDTYHENVLIRPELSLQEIAKRIQKMPSRSQVLSPPSLDTALQHAAGGVRDPLASSPPNSAPNGMTASLEQQEIIDWILSNLDKPNPVQTLTLMHGGAGTRKSFVIHKLQDELLKRGLKTVITCPTGAAASQFPGGQTCRAAFKIGRDGDHISPAKLAELRVLFDNSVGLIITDEVSMLGSEFSVKMDKRLRLIYNPDVPFGGKSILWAGDFMQLEALMGTPLCKAMYKLNASAILIQARDLFRRFRVFPLKSQQRAHSCLVQQKILDSFRVLPPTYPGDSNPEMFQLLTDDVINAITGELITQEVDQDPAWMDEATILVTSNVDKAALTACTARVLALRTNTVVLRWRKPIEDVPQELLELLYSPTDYPNLFGYFVQGGHAQVLDNGNGNVEWGVANGTMCKLVSLAWDDVTDTERVLQQLENVSAQCGAVTDLPAAPDFINVQLITQSGISFLQRRGHRKTIWKLTGRRT